MMENALMIDRAVVKPDRLPGKGHSILAFSR